jgi:hypothetical protein
MAFRLADVKRTVRARSDGERYIHPKILEGQADVSRIALVLNYFEAHLGRMRVDMDAEALLRFLGEPIIARGVVSCLGGTYAWRSRQLADVLAERQVARLASYGITTSTDLRLYLFDVVNQRGDGFLDHVRETNLQPLARRLRLTTAKLDQLVALDAEEHAVLVRSGPVPEPERVLHAYNFAVVDALLRHSETLFLTSVPATCGEELERACARQGVPYERDGEQAVLRGAPDVFGSFARGGGRLTRALYTAAANKPAILRRGRARVRVPGKAAWYELDRKALIAITGETGTIRSGAELAELRDQWDRLRQQGGTAGWRLQINPDPLVTSGGLIVAPAIFRRGEHNVLLWPVTSGAAVDDFLAISQTEISVLAVADERYASDLPQQVAVARRAEGASAIAVALDRHWPAGRSEVAEQALESLLRELTETGFIEEARVVAALGCSDTTELLTRLRSLDSDRGIYIPGIGICNPTFAEAMRRGLRRPRRRSSAA